MISGYIASVRITPSFLFSFYLMYIETIHNRGVFF